MNRDDFVKLVGVASDDDQYVPVAFLLCNGYACAGYYHPPVNKGLASTCVLLNARLIELRGENKVSGQPSIYDFNEFLEEIVVNFCEPSGNGKPSSRTDAYQPRLQCGHEDYTRTRRASLKASDKDRVARVLATFTGFQAHLQQQWWRYLTVERLL